MKPKVILARPFHEEIMKQLQREFDLIVGDDLNYPFASLLLRHPDTQAMISFLSDAVGEKEMRMMPDLKVIANFAVGYNNVDVAAAIRRGIWVTHTPDVLTAATADLTMALILAVTRRLPEADRFTRENRFSGWQADLFLGKDLQGAMLGIVGMGRIGRATAQRAQAFGMTVLYTSHTRKADLEERHGFTWTPLQELAERSDIVSLHLPYSPEVHHLFDRAMFDRMKPDAVFINVARGKLMDEAVLAEKLAKRELFGAGLDVYEMEPQVTEKLKKLENVILLPHIGSATERTRRTMADMTCQAVRQTLAGETPAHLIPEWKNR